MRDLSEDETATVDAVANLMRAAYKGPRTTRPTQGEWARHIILATIGIRGGVQLHHYRAAFDTHQPAGRQPATAPPDIAAILLRAIDLAATEELLAWLQANTPEQETA